MLGCSQEADVGVADGLSVHAPARSPGDECRMRRQRAWGCTCSLLASSFTMVDANHLWWMTRILG